MIKLKDIKFENEGKRIIYNYDYSAEVAKYFSANEAFFVEYDVDVSKIPLSIAVIPFLANMIPIAWFIGFEVQISEVDESFEKALKLLKEEFSKHFPAIKSKSNLKVDTLVKNIFSSDNSALLFSGGLDSFESLTRNLNDNLYLVSVLGADIEIQDTKRWTAFKNFNAEATIINDEKILYVTSNLRTFYTYHVDLLVDKSWWGKIQHGMALISLIAPLSSVYNIRTILIASSNTDEVSFGWGSTSETDEKVKWADQKTIHDGFHLRRTQKVDNIIKFAKATGNYIKLRVCYSEWRNGYNCSRCPKCQRTMLGFIVSGENPNDYGFNTPRDFYESLLKNFVGNPVMSTGVKYEWRCLQEKAVQSNDHYTFTDEITERLNIDKFLKIPVEGILTDKKNEFNRRKFILRNKYATLYKFYLTVRKKINF